jgi:hypothetical protein
VNADARPRARWKDGLTPSERSNLREKAVTANTPKARLFLRWAMVLYLVGFATYSIFMDRLDSLSMVGMLGMLIADYLGLASWKQRRDSRVTIEPDRRLLESVQADEKWLVSITIEQEQVRTGRDYGVMFFRDGMLEFVGHRCQFRVSGEETWKSKADRYDDLSANGESPRWLGIRHVDRRILVGFLVLNCEGSSDIRKGQALITTFRDSKTQGDSLLPPLQRDPNIKPLKDLGKKYLYAAMAATVVGASIGYGSGHWWWGIAAFLLVPAVAFAEPNLRTKRFWEILDREEGVAAPLSKPNGLSSLGSV